MLLGAPRQRSLRSATVTKNYASVNAAYVPTVLTRDEVRRVLSMLDGASWLAAALMYGSGLRLIETLRLRVKDVSFAYRQLTIHDGKGRKGRVVPLPDACTGQLRQQLDTVRVLFDLDRERNLSYRSSEAISRGYATPFRHTRESSGPRRTSRLRPY